jgi:hypothetical protein
MKRFLLMASLLVGLGALVFVAGCSEDDNPVTPPEDNTELNMFLDEFDGMDGLTEDMLGLTFDVVDILLAEGIGKVAAEFVYTLTYHESSQFWVCTIDSLIVDDGTEFSVVDSVQFRYPSGPVQFPVEDSLTEIRSYLTMTASDTAAAGTLFQNVEITVDVPGSDTVDVDGVGGIDLTGTWQDVQGTDTTNCSVDLNFDILATGLVIDKTQDSCPIAGTLQFTGLIAVECTGATEASLTGEWTVTQTFNDGSTTVVVQSGNNQWTVTEACQ